MRFGQIVESSSRVGFEGRWNDGWWFYQRASVPSVIRLTLPPGAPLRRLGAAPACTGATLAHLGQLWRHLGASWGCLARSWAHLGLSWRHIGSSWRHIGGSWRHIGSSWLHLGRILAHLDATLAHLGATFGRRSVFAHATFGQQACKRQRYRAFCA